VVPLAWYFGGRQKNKYTDSKGDESEMYTSFLNQYKDKRMSCNELEIVKKTNYDIQKTVQ
jgi:hypothetical protein